MKWRRRALAVALATGVLGGIIGLPGVTHTLLPPAQPLFARRARPSRDGAEAEAAAPTARTACTAIVAAAAASSMCP
jgi:hypothetical protein